MSQPTYIWDWQRLETIHSNPSIYSNVIRLTKEYADKFVASPPVVITDKDTRFHSDLQDYVSLAIYYWPPTNPSHSRWEHRDGQVNPAYKSYDGGKLEKLEDRLRILSICYYLTGESQYSSAYLLQLQSWFIDKTTSMHPHFKYAQIIPGNNDEGQPWGLIEAYQFNSVIESIRLMDYLGQIDSRTMKSLKRWFKSFSKWMETSHQGKTVNASSNNQSIAYDVTILNMKLFYSGKIDRNISDQFLSKRLLRQISTNGSQPEELKRPRAIHYSAYNLSHIIDFCRLMEHNGINYYSQNKDLIDKAFSYIVTVSDNPQSFPYKELNWEESKKSLYRECTRMHYKTEKPTDFSNSPHTLHL